MSSENFMKMSRLIREHEIGRATRIETPFGRRLITYADLTASGRYLRFVEDWIDGVRPYYANTHTEVSSTGRLMTELREEAREVIRRSLNAGDEDVVVFVGSGATAAINKLVGLLGLRISDYLDREYLLSGQVPPEHWPVVFVGPYEHHSNILPWLEANTEVVEIGMGEDGGIDLRELEQRLVEHGDRPMRIGSFSAASNVTGILTDVRGVCRLLHEHGALAFFDYAAAAPYVPIDMHPGPEEEKIDAVFLSTHKFIGGPGCTGVLAADQALFRTRTPERPGGGTVDYVAGSSRDLVDYVAHLDMREEGGTPAILGDLRAGAAFLVREMLGPEEILRHETGLAAEAVERLSRHPKIQVLGPAILPRLAIISFSIEGQHHDLSSALLDHLFGIQNRPGCACAGPYGHTLLGIDLEHSDRFRRLIQRGIHGIKPGWLRLSLPYYFTGEDIEFCLSATEFVADHGLDFLPLYRMGWHDGVWSHIENPRPAAPPLQLTPEALMDSARGVLREEEGRITDEELRAERAAYFEEAKKLAGELRARWRAHPPSWNEPTGDPAIDELVWFRYVETEGLDRAVTGRRQMPQDQ